LGGQAGLDFVYVDRATGDYSCIDSVFLSAALFEARERSATALIANFLRAIRKLALICN
jgi:hypothetical protein